MRYSGNQICLLALIFMLALLILVACKEEVAPVAAVDPVKDVRIFEDHSEALVRWMKKEYKDMVLVHIDHHPDLAYLPTHKIKVLEDLYKNNQWDEILKHKDSGDILFSLADFVYPAFRLGIIKRLYWVTTLDLFWSRDAESIVHAYLREHDYSDKVINSFRVNGKTATGSVYGLETTISTMDNLPLINEQVLLSIDIDYFSNIMKESKMNELKVISDFFTILRDKKLRIKDMDITYSVNGGYTAITDKHIGDELVHMFENPGIIHDRNYPELWRIRDRGFNLIRNDDIENALHLFTNSLLVYPEEPTMLLGKAVCLCYKGMDGESFDAIARLLKIRPDYEPVYIYLGKALARKGEVWNSKLYTYEYLKRHPELYFQKDHLMKPSDNRGH